MTQQVNKSELSERQMHEIDEMALDRVRAMNSDEYLCQRIDLKVQALEDHLKAYFHQRFAAHQNKESDA